MSKLQVEKLSYQYEDGTKALDEVSFEIKSGQKIALVGANGSGKSTLFLCLNGILRPNSGIISYEGKPIQYNRKGLMEVRSKVGIVFQEPDHQLFSSSVYEDISFGVLNMGDSKEEAKEKVDKIILEMELNGFCHKPTHFLSGGQKKQVSIADVLVMDPEIILFDEPAAALDPKHTKLVYERLDQLHEKGITTLVSTHDMNHAYDWADQVLVFKEGRLLKAGAPQDIFTDDRLLEEAGIEKPFVIELFDKICISEEHRHVPKTIDELADYIKKR